MDAERTRLEAGLRSSNAFVLRRGQILLASARGVCLLQIAQAVGCDDQMVRTVIRRLEGDGLDACLTRRTPALPQLRSWTEPDQPIRLIEQSVATNDPDGKALACCGLLHPDRDQVWLRPVDGRPVSSITTQFLAWRRDRLAREGKTALVLV